MNKNKIIAVKLKGPSKDKAYWQKKLTTWEAECNPIKSLERSRIEKLISVSDQGLEVEGDLNLYDYAYLTSLPADLKVGGNLNLRGRTSLISVADLEVGGDLNLKGCTSLISVAGLKVGGDVNLEGCTSLQL